MASNYRKLTQIEHILARSDTYIGSINTEVDKEFVLSSAGDSMEVRSVEYNPGLLKVADEVLVNAIDQSSLDETLDQIKVEVDVESGSISVYNTGRGIPVEKHQEYGVYAPELIFGNLLTSSNYDDTQERTTGGRNGLGAKLTNVYSKKFEVEVVDPERKLKYKQTWTDNMGKMSAPKITTLTKESPKGYVKITFWPDLKRFGMDSLGSGDNVSMIQRRVWDAAACTHAGVKVYWNGKMVPIKTFEKYVDMFIGSKADAKRVYICPHPRWEIVVAVSQSGFKSMSFVNGIATTKGGSHVNYIVNQVIDGLKGLNKKKDVEIKPAYVKDHMFVFVRCVLVNPTFSSQAKTECTSKVAAFGSRVVLDDDFFKKVAKLGILDEAVALARHKETRELTKTDGVKKTTIRGIPKLEDANKAGTKESHKCVLVLTEGDSAKTFAISGLSVVGRDYWGVFPLRGKLLNVRDASTKSIMENQEIQQLKQILGLQQGKEYTDVSSLRYGRVMILTDADVDGSHIRSLLINMFDHFWPSLLKLGFVCTLNTPIIKAFKNSQVVSFNTQHEYNEWKKQASGGWKVKYFKGLGTSTAEEARDYFRRVNELTQTFTYGTTEDSEAIVLAFKKTNTKERKEWIMANTSNPQLLNRAIPKISVSEVINKDLVHFSIADVVRSIPSMVDGLKPSQRKVLYGCFKRGHDKDDIKVSQLSGFIGEATAYHHGDASLQGTIVGMAQDFVGSNNLNLLMPMGQFGTRLQGGKDMASARYIFTKLNPVTRKIFDPRDDPLLDHLSDDGFPIEPKYFVPVLPMVLVNGASGIGTGFSTNVPCYNPLDLKKNIKRHLVGKPMEPMVPWYHGFTGTIEQAKPGTWITKGTFTTPKPGWLYITELPIGSWTQDYKEWLEDDGKRPFDILNYENHSTETTVLFKLQLRPETLRDIQAGDAYKMLNLVSTLHTTNMYLFGADGAIKYYEDPLAILADFVAVRTKFYKLRKKHMLGSLKHDVSTLSERVRFIRAVVNDELVVFKRPVSELTAEMKASGYKDIEALLRIPLSSLTMERIQELEKERDNKHAEYLALEGTASLQLWLDDLKHV